MNDSFEQKELELTSDDSSVSPIQPETDSSGQSASADAIGESTSRAPEPSGEESTERDTVRVVKKSSETARIRVKKKPTAKKKEPAAPADPELPDGSTESPESRHSEPAAESAPQPQSRNGKRRGKKNTNRGVIKGPQHDPDAPKLLINDLSRMTMPELRELGIRLREKVEAS